MLIAIIGESCVGKSTLANKLNERLNAKIYTGKDYLRLNKNEEVATREFKKILNNITQENIIYIISEKDQLSLLPDNAFNILVTADLELIKDRFKNRLNGKLPLPVEKMVEAKHGIFNDIRYDYKIENSLFIIDDLLDAIKIKLKNK